MRRLPLIVLSFLLAACAPLAAPATITPSPALTPTFAPTDTPMPTRLSTKPNYTPPTASEYAPRPDDKQLSRGNVFLTDHDIVLRESLPLQITLALQGSLPTPCHQLRVAISTPDDNTKRWVISAYSVVDPTLMCTQVLKNFEAYIALGTLRVGGYTVELNGEVIGEIK